MMRNVVAIDGPAGSGKSTVSRIAAERLGFTYLDTGAMYRALTLRAIKSGISLEDEKRVEQVVASANLEFENGFVLLNGTDVTKEIRSNQVTRHVPTVAAYPSVRAVMLVKQRLLADNSAGIVMEGRDIGTVVFPDARWKFYLDAKPEVRAKRRQKELELQGKEREFGAVLEDILKRDKEDSERQTAPLRRASDAILIDTSELSINETVEKIITEIESKKPYAVSW